MKRLYMAMIAVCAIAGAATADAALLCKNSINQEIRWQKGWPKPELYQNDDGSVFKSEGPKAFDVSKDTICYVSAEAYRYAAQTGLPIVPVDDLDSTQGVIYRGWAAQFLLENLPAFDGKPARKQDLFDRKP